MNPNLIALQILQRVFIQGESLSHVIPQELKKNQNSAGLIKEICFGVNRWYGQLNFILNKLISKPLKAKDSDINLLIMIGLYQLIYLSVPQHAVVNQVVTVCDILKKSWAKGLTNATLRQFLRKKTELLNLANKNELASFSHPTWLINKIKKDWPNNWTKILKSNNERPPLMLRVNSAKIKRDDYLLLLKNADITAYDDLAINTCITLEKPQSVNTIPKFPEGYVSVQDGAAQAVIDWMDLQNNQYVLDACAAPGGKTCSMLENNANIQITAVDISSERTQQITENLQRLDLKATVLTSDICELDKWWNKKLFDRILVDAPCSSSGVIRRHPDIKWLRQPDDILNLQKQQLKILSALWSTLKTDGLIIYTTCSIFPEENDQVIAQFIANHPDAKIDLIEPQIGQRLEYGVQVLPDKYDGFYYSRLKKMTSAQ